MQAYKEEKEDLTKPAYACPDCGNVFLGRPIEKPCPGYFDEDGAWIESEERFTVAFECHDVPPCEPYLSLDSFQVGTLQDMVARGYNYVKRPSGEVTLIQKSDRWRCGNCEGCWEVDDYGARTAERRAVSCCQ